MEYEKGAAIIHLKAEAYLLCKDYYYYYYYCYYIPSCKENTHRPLLDY